MSQSRSTIPIKYWAEDDRPREKLLLKGRDSLSDSELIAILLGSGSQGESAVELARRILKDCHHSLSQVSKLSIRQLMEYKGIGEAKAIGIAAALELGRRRGHTEVVTRPSIRSSVDAYDLMVSYMADLDHEEFWLILLNNSNSVIGKELISKGGVSATVVDMKIVFKKALQEPASGVIMVHNHPSGATKPSKQDIELTWKASAAGKVLDIPLIDHIIVGDQAYYSFADNSNLEP